MQDKKSYYKGLVTGVALCILLVGLMLLSGCFLKDYLPSSEAKQPSQNTAQQGTDGDDSGDKAASSDDLSDHYDEIVEKLDDLQEIVNMYFLSDETVSTDEMIEGIYKGYIDSLGEAYSVYYTAEEYAQLQESSSGKYSGIGVVVSQNVQTGVITVVRPFPGSPGEEAGILKDDIIYKIDDKEVTGEDVSEVVTWIKGKEGTKVTIEVFRPSENDYMTFAVERRTIEVPMVEYRMLEDHIGYAAIYEFEETTAEQFDKAMKDLTAQGMEGLIIDLRDNPGGLVKSATAILDRILPKDKLLVYTVDKREYQSEEFSEDDITIDVPITVLINENSASASEIVSGCLQDYERATLVGTTSFGKGIVQYVLPMSDGSAIKLTSAKYYTPDGRNIHGIGIEPDVVVEQDEDPESDSDNQLDKAVQVLKSEIEHQ